MLHVFVLLNKGFITSYSLIKFSGYMSPEYAMEGLFSVKSDVFAFGVLMLEIISGKKNTGFYGSDYLSLLGYVSSDDSSQYELCFIKISKCRFTDLLPV